MSPQFVMQSDKKKKRRKKGRVVYIMFDDDGDSCSVSSDNSLPSVVIGPEDFDVGDAPAKRYRRAFLALATIAIFFGLYYPTAIMKTLTDGQPVKGLRDSRQEVRRQKQKEKTPTEPRTDRTLEQTKRKQHESTETLEEEDGEYDPDSKLDFDTFLQKQEEQREKHPEPVRSKLQQQDPATIESKPRLHVDISLPRHNDAIKNTHQVQRIQRESAPKHPIVVPHKDDRFVGMKVMVERSSIDDENLHQSQGAETRFDSASSRDRSSNAASNGQGREQGKSNEYSRQRVSTSQTDSSDGSLAIPSRNNLFEVSDHYRQMRQSSRGYVSNIQMDEGAASNVHRRLTDERQRANNQGTTFSQRGGGYQDGGYKDGGSQNGGYQDGRYQDDGQAGHVQQQRFPADMHQGQPLPLVYGPQGEQSTQNMPKLFNQQNEQSMRSGPAMPNQQSQQFVQNSNNSFEQQNQQSMQGSSQIFDMQNQQPVQRIPQSFGQQNEHSPQDMIPMFDQQLQQSQRAKPQQSYQQGEQSQLGMSGTFGGKPDMQDHSQIYSLQHESSDHQIRNGDQERMDNSVLQQSPDESPRIPLHGGINGAHHSPGNERISPHQDSIQHQDRQSSGPPSYVEICKIVLGGNPGEMLQENNVCFDESDPSLSLAHIFFSTYLAQKAKEHAYQVNYQHNCGGHRAEPRLIQELLPSPLQAAESGADDLSAEQLQSFCMLIEKNEKKGSEQATPLEMLLWDTSVQHRRLSDSGNLPDPHSETAPISMLERLVPLLQANLYQAAMMSRAVKTSLKAGYGVLKGRDIKSEKVAVGRAVIYLPCRDHLCQDLVLVPYISYLMHIPYSVHVIDIVAPPECMNNLAGCRKYVEDLASTSRQFIPQMSVEVISAEPSSPDVIDRLIEAEHVICGPGFGSTCLFPALGKPGGRVTLFDVGPEQIEGDSASSFVARLPPELIKHVNPPTSTFHVAALSSFGMNQDKAVAFAQRSPDKSTGDCRFARGRYGVWTEDLVYAEHAQYRTPLRHYSGNAETFFRRKSAQGQYGDLKHRPSTTYRWDELRYQTCPVSQITQEGICDVLESMGVKRIFILGDSLNLQLAQSMWMWLTTERFGDSPTEKGQLDPNFSAKIQCPGYGSYTLQFIRNDELLENDEPVSIDNEQKNCGTYCFSWTEEYLKSHDRTVLLVNAGAHIHEKKRFEAAIDRFVETFDGMNRPNDIVLFRTLVPGHWDCARPGLKPFLNFAAYLKDAEEHPNPKDDIYGWSKFSEYNDYAIRALDQRRFLPPDDQPRALMEVLDVFPMTVLRPDGHCSDEFRPPKYLDTDCLHYTLAGPIDWWSHLAYSHLLDIATAETFLANQ